jgi:hypothetical protein
VLRRACRRARVRAGVPAGPHLTALLESLDREAALTPVGRRLARAGIVELLATRLRLDALRAESPEIFARPVVAPIVVLGAPRTGTTLMQRLVSLLPECRSLAAWETFRPLPPARSRAERRARRRHARRVIAAMRYHAPYIDAVHPPSVRQPDEDRQLQAAGFVSGHFAMLFDVPSYWAYLLAQPRDDPTDTYGPHRGLLQALQWHEPGRWVLKSPAHRLFPDALFAAYPDAVVVETVREGRSALASFCSLVATLRHAFSDRVVPGEIGRFCVQATLELDERVHRARARFGDRFLDVAYEDLVADPVATLRTVCAHAELPWNAAREAVIRGWLANTPAPPPGRHRYTPDEWGIPEEEELRVAADPALG